MPESQKAGKDDRPTTPQLEVPHEERSSSRHTSPVRLSAELTLKVQTQWSRVASLKGIVDALPADPGETSQEELTHLLACIEELHKAFTKEHAYFEVSWPAALLEHEYFTRKTHGEETTLYLTARRSIGRLKHALTPAPSQPTAPLMSSSTEDNSNLPDLSLPKFSGTYADWPNFRDLFGSMVMDNQQLSNIKKLHYLRASLEGEPLKLITGLALCNASLMPSWDTLKDRYENKRLLINSYLDKLFDSSNPIPRKAASLNDLISTTQESLSSLENLGVATDKWDTIIVYHAVKRLDRVTREQWETTIGAEKEYPRYDRFLTFLKAHARALENIESTASAHNVSSSVSSPRKVKVAAHQTTQGKAVSDSITFPCDWCKGPHYIVTCTKFRDLSPAERQKVAVDKRLCYNCLGRHNVRSCKSSIGSKKCSQRHHTMLHETHTTLTSAQPAASSSNQSSN